MVSLMARKKKELSEEQINKRVQWLEESVLSYAQRKKLPKKVFCGPDKSYPAHDRKHASNCLARASQNKARLGASYGRVVACCRRALKRFGGKPATAETVEDPLITWFKKQRGVE